MTVLAPSAAFSPQKSQHTSWPPPADKRRATLTVAPERPLPYAPQKRQHARSNNSAPNAHSLAIIPPGTYSNKVLFSPFSHTPSAA